MNQRGVPHAAIGVAYMAAVAAFEGSLRDQGHPLDELDADDLLGEFAAENAYDPERDGADACERLDERGLN